MWWSRRERLFRAIVRDVAGETFAAHGIAVWRAVYPRSRDLGLPAEERQYFMAVRRELERLMGVEPRADTATRWGSADPVFKGSQDDDCWN